MHHSTLLGLDIGQARIGVARASTVARLAEPLMVLKTTQAIARLQSLITKHKVEALVAGLPRNLSGDDTAQTAWVRNWVRQARAKIDLPFYWQDEALTSRQAQNLKLKTKSPGQDADAAAIILQDFLDTPESERIGY